jgi:hypothetical protein
MDDALKTYLQDKETRAAKPASVKTYGENVAKAMPTIVKDLREGNKLASQLRVSGAAANRAEVKKP